jgi:alpha-amylase
MEMGEWALPTRTMKEYNDALAKVKGSPDFAGLRPFIKGGIWRNFLAKYPESNQMHKRMLTVSRKVHDALDMLDAKGVKKNVDAGRMLDHLYQSQCNDSYWHGVFGGLYLPHLRSAVYEHLIRAEYIADSIRNQQGQGSRVKGPGKKKQVSWLEIEQDDFDRDGSMEVMMNSELMNIFIDPADGGRIVELDWKPRSFNLTNTLTRRREVYHEKILHLAGDRAAGSSGGGTKTIHELVAVKEEGLQYHLLYDWYTRGSLLDHFLGSGVDLVNFMRSEYYESGDFVLGAYGMRSKRTNNSAVVTLERDGNVEGLPVRLRKDLSLSTGVPGLNIRYAITNQSGDELNASFGSEFNFSLLAGNAHDRYYDIPGHTLEKRNLASTGETNNVMQVSLVDEWLKLKLTLGFSEAAILWRAPVETVSQSEAGFERVYQSSMVMPLWRISLSPGASWETEIRVKVE